MTVENISQSNLHERMLATWWGSNPQPPDYQLDTLIFHPYSMYKFQDVISNGAKYVEWMDE